MDGCRSCMVLITACIALAVPHFGLLTDLFGGMCWFISWFFIKNDISKKKWYFQKKLIMLSGFCRVWKIGISWLALWNYFTQGSDKQFWHLLFLLCFYCGWTADLEEGKNIVKNWCVLMLSVLLKVPKMTKNKLEIPGWICMEWWRSAFSAAFLPRACHYINFRNTFKALELELKTKENAMKIAFNEMIFRFMYIFLRSDALSITHSS